MTLRKNLRVFKRCLRQQSTCDYALSRSRTKFPVYLCVYLVVEILKNILRQKKKTSLNIRQNRGRKGLSWVRLDCHHIGLTSCTKFRWSNLPVWQYPSSFFLSCRVKLELTQLAFTNSFLFIFIMKFLYISIYIEKLSLNHKEHCFPCFPSQILFN